MTKKASTPSENSGNDRPIDPAAQLRPDGRPRGGRRKGEPNKITGSIKEMIETALSNAGGAEYLTRQAKANPAAFMALVGKLVPKDLKVEGHLQVDHKAAVSAAVQAMMANLFKPPTEGAK